MEKNSWKKWIYGGARRDGRFHNEGVSFVYVLRAPYNLCKIGLSSEPRWRILRHRRDCYVALELICLVRHSRAADLELRLHNHFRKLGRKSPTVDECLALGILVGDQWHYEQQWNQYEWFWLTEDDIKWLRSKSTEEVNNTVA